MTNDVLWDYNPDMNTGEPMHISAGLITHFFDEVRKKIREFESNASFIRDARKSAEDIGKVIDLVATSKQSMKDKSAPNVNIPLHQESLRIRRDYEKKLNEIEKKKKERAETLKGYAEDEALEVREEFEEIYLEELDELEEEYNSDIAQLEAEAKDIYEKCNGHALETNYAHNLALGIGYTRLSTALKKFLSNSSKRPHGVVEFVLDKAIEQRGIGGGKYMAEHSGFEQTNGNGLNSLMNFEKIAKACISIHRESDQEYTEVKEMFDKFNDVARKLYPVCTHLKSQDKCDPDIFDKCVLDFIDAFEDVFKVPCFNKLHYLHAHTTAFVRKYGCVGRLSAESHEAAHARFSRAMKHMNKMPSTQMAKSIFSRTSSSLNALVQSAAKQIKDKKTGKKRGPYQTKVPLREDIDYDAEYFGGSYERDGDKFFLVPGGGCIGEKYKAIYEYVVHGRAPREWVDCFGGVVSDFQMHQISFSRY